MYYYIKYVLQLIVALTFSFTMVFPLCPAATGADTGDQPGNNKPVTLRIMVVLAEFPDAIHKITPAEIKKRIFTDVSDYFQEASYGLITLTGDITADWIMMPKPVRSYGDLNKFIGMQEIRFKLAFDAIRAADDRVDYKNYDKVIVFVPTSISMVNFAIGQPIQTNDSISVSWVTVQRENVSSSIIAHELGHALGLPDLYDTSMAQSGDYNTIYMGPWCLMSSGASVHPCGFSKRELGWIPSTRMVELPAGTKQWVSLQPLEVKTDGIQLIKINKSGQTGSSQYYLVEARRKTGVDKNLPDEGILITSVDESKAQRGGVFALSIYGPPGFVKLVKPDEDATSLNNATFDLGKEKINVFKDAPQDLAVIVFNWDGKAYDVAVTRLGEADAIAEAAMQLYKAKSAIEAAPGASAGAADVQKLLVEARNKYNACVKAAQLEGAMPTDDQINAITALLQQAEAAGNRYLEASAQLEKASISIKEAEKEGRSGGLDKAGAQLDAAKSALAASDYDKTLIASLKTQKLAQQAVSPFMYWINSLFSGTPAPRADFEIVSMDIPAQGTLGQVSAATVKLANTGDASGSYGIKLTDEGQVIAKQDVTVPGSSLQSITLTFMPDKTGTRSIKAGNIEKTMTVKKLVEKSIELKYDTGQQHNYLSSTGGHLVEFIPPATPFTITAVRISAIISAKAESGVENRPFDLQILDRDLKVIHTDTYTYNKFPVVTDSQKAAPWVDFNTPAIKVEDRFYVHMFTKSPYPGLHVGACDNITNEHSDLTTKDSKGRVIIATPWPYNSQYWYGNKSKVNWMIRVVGTGKLPED